MNAPIPPIWTTGTTEGIKTGTWRAALPHHIHAPSPCHAACPVNGDIAEWIGNARAGDWRGAWEILTRHNPFPAVAGRVCHHPCEAVCNRAGFDAPLAIRGLERYVGDLALREGWRFAPVRNARNERVAVVGGGPSGLSAAFQLRRRGYAVSLFEALPQLGGLMRAGIPSYRLPRVVLDGEVARIVALGIDVRCGEAVATAEHLRRLRMTHDAVYLASGAGKPKRLAQLDYARPWVLDGADYLARVNAGAAPALGPRVIVIGGGSAALDAARCARRGGHAVTILALESEAQLPAQPEEVVEAIDEGIVFECGTMLERVIEKPGVGLVAGCVRVSFEPVAQRGRFAVQPGSGFLLAADAIVVSIGQDPDPAPLRTLAAEASLLRVDARMATSMEGVYAGGDVTSPMRFVTEAIGMGKRAALEIDRVLGGAGDRAVAAERVVEPGAINAFYYRQQARAAEPRLPPARRLASGGEVQLGFEAAQVHAEAARCFSCGTCVFCDNCVHYCPDLAVQRTGGRYVVLTDYCKGCGLCVKECPTGSMKMVEEAR